MALCIPTSSSLRYQPLTPSLPTLRWRCQPGSTYPAALGDADEFIQVGLIPGARVLQGHGAPNGAISLGLAPVQGPGEAWGGQGRGGGEVAACRGMKTLVGWQP